MMFTQDKFLWGVASAAYQVEGGYQADDKGRSNWDVYTNDYQVTKAFIGKQDTGNVAINFYERSQYLQDIALMKQLGVNAYRFSIAWSRILPDGIGEINSKGIAYYSQLIDDLLANEIEPVVTNFHWDLPYKLQEKGGWVNPDSVQWYAEYANVLFKNYSDRVKKFITFNEPFINIFFIEPLAHNAIKKKTNTFAISNETYGKQAEAVHHLLLASATAIQNYHQLNLDGAIGITLSFTPTLPLDPNNAEDVQAATIFDGLHNRWFLDAMYRGEYPDDIMKLHQKYNPDFKVSAEDMQLIVANQPDFIGVNFYAPAYVKADNSAPYKAEWFSTNPDEVKMFNGPVRPEYLYKLLMWIKNEYGNPVIYITENGAGFGEIDEQLEGDLVKDPLRTDYIKRHIDIALQAKRDGVDLRGYMLWSFCDNFEWLFGYDKRFGIVYVDFDSQQRIPKQSFYAYQQIIQEMLGE